MNMSTVPATDTAEDLPAYTRPRRLDEDVFQTAEEAVLVEGLGNTAALLPTNSSANAFRGSGGSRSLPFTHAIGAYVAARPCQSALLAATAGALAMLALRSQLRGRFQPLRTSRLR